MTSKAQEAHDSVVSKDKTRWRLDVRRLEKAAKRGEITLQSWRPLVVQVVDENARKKRRRRDFYDMDTTHWKLRGAARPASEVYALSLGLADPNAPIVDHSGENLLEKYAGRLYDGPAPCREHLETLLALGRALHDAGRSLQALPHYRRCLELDAPDRVGARGHLARCLLDASAVADARELVESAPGDKSTGVRWTLAAIEFIAFHVLQEEGSSAEAAEAALAAAYQVNPYVCWWLAYRETFEQVVEHAEEIQDPPIGSVEEAFWYGHREGRLWAGLLGSSEWALGYISKKRLEPPLTQCSAVAAVNSGGGAVSGNSDGDSDGGSDSDGRVSRGGGNGGRGNDGDGNGGGVADFQDDEAAFHADMFAEMFNTAIGMATEEQRDGAVTEERDEAAADEDGGAQDEGDDDEDAAALEHVAQLRREKRRNKRAQKSGFKNKKRKR